LREHREPVRFGYLGHSMNALLQVFADSRAHREEAMRARKLAESAHGQLQSELLAIAELYEGLADGKDSDENGTARGHRLDESKRAMIAARLSCLMLGQENQASSAQAGRTSAGLAQPPGRR
jgi:hypothetical protein